MKTTDEGASLFMNEAEGRHVLIEEDCDIQTMMCGMLQKGKR